MNTTISFNHVRNGHKVERAIVLDIEKYELDGAFDLNMCDLNRSFVQNLNENRVRIYNTYDEAKAVADRYVKLCQANGTVTKLNTY